MGTHGRIGRLYGVGRTALRMSAGRKGLWVVMRGGGRNIWKLVEVERVVHGVEVDGWSWGRGVNIPGRPEGTVDLACSPFMQGRLYTVVAFQSEL